MIAGALRSVATFECVMSSGFRPGARPHDRDRYTPRREDPVTARLRVTESVRIVEILRDFPSSLDGRTLARDSGTPADNLFRRKPAVQPLRWSFGLERT